MHVLLNAFTLQKEIVFGVILIVSDLYLKIIFQYVL